MPDGTLFTFRRVPLDPLVLRRAPTTDPTVQRRFPYELVQRRRGQYEVLLAGINRDDLRQLLRVIRDELGSVQDTTQERK